MNTEERQNEAQEKSALAEATAVAKRKSKDMANKMVKKVALAFAKAAIPMFLALLKVLAVVILVAVITSLIGSALDWFSGSGGSGDDMQSVATGNSNVSILNQVATDELEQFIQECGTTNTALKDELLNQERIAQIEQWQTDTGYSGILLVAIMFQQQVAVDDLEDTFLPEINTKGLEWKNAGYTTVEQIAEDYVGDETATKWANNIIARMENSDIFANTSSGDGYTGIYTKTTLAPEIPKKYREYKQIQGSYKDHVWIRYTNSAGNEVTSTIYWDGCCLTSIATIVSGYKNQDISPLDIVMEITDNVGYMSSFSPGTALSAYGITYSRPYFHNYIELSDTQKRAIINHVATGKPVIIYVLGTSRGGNSGFTSKEHWMAILDYGEATNKLYVSNPSGITSDKTGWIDADYVLTSCTEYIAITN